MTSRILPPAVQTNVALRQATAADLPQLIGMVEQFRTASLYQRYLAQNAGQVEHTLAWMLSVPAAAIFVAERETELIGMLGVISYTHPISGAKTASELFWWLNPADRGWGGWLLRRGEKWAKANGCESMQMIAPSDAPRVSEIYQRLGYDLLELAYTKRLV